MLCKIADLYVQVPTAGGLASRCKEYICTDTPGAPVFHIREELFEPAYWPGLSYDRMCYMESGSLFHRLLLQNNGLRLHASAVEWQGRAYLFSANSGVGKSTHTRLWQKLYGEDAQVFNDDKPALRFLEGRWYAYGTPWCGKDGINQNKKVPLAGICFLQRGEKNTIRTLAPGEAVPRVINQTNCVLDHRQDMELLLSHIDRLLRSVPIFLLECTPTLEAAKLSSETMSQCARKL